MPPPIGVTIVSASEEPSCPDVLTILVHSLSPSSGDDHPLSSFLPCTRRLKTQTYPTQSPHILIETLTSSHPTPPDAPKTVVVVTSDLPPFELLLQAIPNAPSIDLPVSSWPTGSPSSSNLLSKGIWFPISLFLPYCYIYVYPLFSK